MGFQAEMELKRVGFYPKGGGEIISSIEPVGSISPLKIKERGDLVKVFGISAIGGLPRMVAERGRNRVLQILGEKGIPNQIEIRESPSYGRGAIIFLKAEFEKTTACFSELGEIGKRMEEVSEEACQKLLNFLKGDATIDANTADQLILPLALAPGKSLFRVPKVTRHITTNAEVIKSFLEDAKIQIEGNEISVEGIGWGQDSIRKHSLQDRSYTE